MIKLVYSPLYDYIGTIPQSIQKLSQLTYLVLSNNFLSGTIKYMNNYHLKPSSEIVNVTISSTRPKSHDIITATSTTTVNTPAMTVQLINNRLSGDIPTSFQT